ncbi:Oral cancer-overexpressed protein 1-like protein [Trichoplax sp. H2]|nr:Oral cancer-overexpressed protein 1-like protein [Trichoplax sp. H2]|eukprot:RDD46066.1 Oral cancer-overexpressed protein 1-like protein [Trichoplax sp. H2]
MDPFNANSQQNDDLFDEITLAANQRQENAYLAGVQKGGEIGYQNGMLIGRQKGLQLAAEIGFYSGFVSTWLAMIESDKTVLLNNALDSNSVKSKQIKITKCLQALQAQLQHYNQTFQQNHIHHLTEELSKLRSRFKQLCSLLKYPPNNVNISDLTF